MAPEERRTRPPRPERGDGPAGDGRAFERSRHTDGTVTRADQAAWIRRLVEHLPPAEIGRFRVAFQESVQKFATQDGIWMDVTTIFAAGVKPG